MMTRISTLKNHERFHQASVGSKQKTRRDEKENASFGIKANNKKCFLIMGNSTPIRNVCVCVRSYKTPVRMSVSCTQRSMMSRHKAVTLSLLVWLTSWLKDASDRQQVVAPFIANNCWLRKRRWNQIFKVINSKALSTLSARKKYQIQCSLYVNVVSFARMLMSRRHCDSSFMGRDERTNKLTIVIHEW